MKGGYKERNGSKPGDEWKDINNVIRLASWELGAPRFPNDGVPVLLTTRDIHAEELAFRFLPWLLRKVPQLEQWERDKKYYGAITALRLHLEEFTICRRLEIHDLPAAIFLHIVRCAVETAQHILHQQNLPTTTEERFEKSWGIRVVIDDLSILKNTYVEIRDEPLWLRFLVFYLGREGVTTLLIDTQPGQPDAAVSNLLDNELRSLVNNHLYTWRFSFYGENRVAISPISPEMPALVRELRYTPKSEFHPELDLARLVVDPHFELYDGVEKGEPQPIPLHVRLFAETENFKAYIEEGNIHFLERFEPLPAKVDQESGKILIGIPPTQYDKLRDFCYLQRDTRLDHTLIFQVDEFWCLRRPAVRHSGTFSSQREYLSAAVSYTSGKDKEGKDVWIRDWAIDSFDLFQQTGWKDKDDSRQTESNNTKTFLPDHKMEHHRRRQEFAPYGYQFEEKKQERAFREKEHRQERKHRRERGEEIRVSEYVDRVPFMWDFGFLLCKQKQWIASAQAKLAVWNKTHSKDDPLTVQQIWERLPKALKNDKLKRYRPSWRQFLEACHEVARAESYRIATPVPAFDLHAIAAQSFSCLVLEIWMSEIYQRLEDKSDQLKSFVESVSERKWNFDVPEEGLIEWLAQEECQIDLFKTWLLLVEALDLTALAEVVRGNELSYKECNPHAITVRHWYKTACRTTEQMSLDDPLVPVGLPGHFSTRGDWFLGVAGGSRSIRLADKALDLLNSRRANDTRLRLGLGLPVRRIEKDVQKELRTGLVTLDRGHDLQGLPKDATYRTSKVSYASLLKLGGPHQAKITADFHWLWRSSLRQYYRHARIWQDWLNRQILHWERLRYLERNAWVNGFERYDWIVDNRKRGLYVVDEKGKLERDKQGEYVKLKVWEIFQDSCKELRDELLEATRQKSLL